MNCVAPTGNVIRLIGMVLSSIISLKPGATHFIRDMFARS
jgi:hypothetical protein